ncbi:MAG: dethiobiotin synthase [Leptospira sp.]|nr:dethiobiotin synthase [Leptospira sp.]
MNRAFFVTGTGTDIGKTFFSSLFLAKYGKSHNFKYWKPIQTGLSESNDTKLIQKITEFDDSFFLKPIYELKFPSNPFDSAKREKIELNINLIRETIAKERTNPVLLEGAGGLFVPLNESYLLWQLIRESNLNVILVCSSELGTINHTLMSLESMLQRFIPVVGFYMVGPKNDLIENNIEMIQKFGGTPCLGYTTFPNQKLSAKDFLIFANEHFDSKRMVIDSLLDTGDIFETE